MSDHGQYRVSRNMPPISSRPPSAPPHGSNMPHHTGRINWKKLPGSLEAAQGAVVALGFQAATSRRAAQVVKLLLSAAGGVLVTYVILKRRKP